MKKSDIFRKFRGVGDIFGAYIRGGGFICGRINGILRHYFQRNTDTKNEKKLFLLCRPTGPIFFAVLLVDQKINLVLPNMIW